VIVVVEEVVLVVLMQLLCPGVSREAHLPHLQWY
jgi:hypothetical protein